ncbi:MAG: NTP transferase domain-containing protein [Hyphomicrobiales bacterium]
MKAVASIEARMGSSRLPGKMMVDIAVKPALARVVERARACRNVEAIVLATTTAPEDDELAALARKIGIAVHRGSEEDVLKRVLDAQAAQESDLVIQICGDCPLLDPDIVDQAVSMFLGNDCDVIAMGVQPSYPQGTEVQVFRLSALRYIDAHTTDPAHREHVSLYFHEHPDQFRPIHLMAPAALARPEQRLQLDYPEDLEVIRRIYGALEPQLGGAFRTADILAYLDSHPDVARLNAHCEERPARP